MGRKPLSIQQVAKRYPRVIERIQRPSGTAITQACSRALVQALQLFYPERYRDVKQPGLWFSGARYGWTARTREELESIKDFWKVMAESDE